MKELKSKYFKLNEFTTSQTATRLNIDNSPSDDIIDNLQMLCTKVLDVIREKIAKPIVISSGYRCPELNKRIGGVETPPSQHTMGKAADIIVPGMTSKQVFDFISVKIKIPYDQIIEEFGQWVHVSYDKDKAQQRGNKLIASKVDGKTVYTRMA